MAGKKHCTVSLRIPEDLLRKLLLLCEREGRTLNAELTMLARNAIAYHERAKGNLDAKQAAAIDLTAYSDENESKN